VQCGVHVGKEEKARGVPCEGRGEEGWCSVVWCGVVWCVARGRRNATTQRGKRDPHEAKD
jgi:hypothetical protein